MNTATITLIDIPNPPTVWRGKFYNLERGIVPTITDNEPHDCTVPERTWAQREMEMPKDDSRGWLRNEPLYESISVYPRLGINEGDVVAAKSRHEIINWYAAIGQDVEVKKSYRDSKKQFIVTRTA